MKCFPTYVRHLPTGDEVGKFLALDLGGTNFRVLVIDIQPEKRFIMDSEVYAIERQIMEGSGDELFDHIAKCLAHFVKDRNLEDETKRLPLGFTFRWVYEGSLLQNKRCIFLLTVFHANKKDLQLVD